MPLPLFTDAAGRLCYDPDGSTYGLPAYPWRGAPPGLATYRQLAAAGLRPGGHDPVAMLLRPRRRRGPLIAYLYRIDRARPKRQVTPAMQAASATAIAAKRRCHDCGTDRGYIPPARTGRRCLVCADRDAVAA